MSEMAQDGQIQMGLQGQPGFRGRGMAMRGAPTRGVAMRGRGASKFDFLTQLSSRDS